MVYPFLFGTFPLLRLYAANADRLAFRYTLIPFGIAVLSLLALYGVFRLHLKDAPKAGLAVTAVALLFFNYGRARGALHGIDHRILWPAFLLLMIAVPALIHRQKRNLQSWTAPLNVFSIAISLVVLYPATKALSAKSEALPPVPLTLPTQPPDIYYIILDAYGRDDILREHFAFDNSPFLGELEKRGFKIPRKSRSNYLFTILSLPSSLNLDYLDTLHPTPITSTAPLVELIETNRVARSLKAAGYRFINLPSGLSFTNQSRIADVNYGSLVNLREFSSMVGQTTMLAPWFKEETEQVSPGDLQNIQKILLETPKLPGPKFVFAHFLSPHPPYQFRADGSPAHPAPPGVTLNWSDKDGYTQQIQYLNRFVLQAVDHIVRTSKTPPIIIIQGDHGPALRDDTPTQNALEPWTPTNFHVRSSILNAYLVPESIRPKIPEDVTPVNSFRILFRELFKADLPDLKNETWYSNQAEFFKLKPVPRDDLP